jgi:hypothetical protein
VQKFLWRKGFDGERERGARRSWCSFIGIHSPLPQQQHLMHMGLVLCCGYIPQLHTVDKIQTIKTIQWTRLFHITQTKHLTEPRAYFEENDFVSNIVLGSVSLNQIL